MPNGLASAEPMAAVNEETRTRENFIMISKWFGFLWHIFQRDMKAILLSSVLKIR